MLYDTIAQNVAFSYSLSKFVLLARSGSKLALEGILVKVSKGARTNSLLNASKNEVKRSVPAPAAWKDRAAEN
jgi:hypothetical protein